MRALPFAADVAGQDDRHVADPQLEHDGILVPDALAFPLGRARVQHANLDARRSVRVARLHRPPGTPRAVANDGERAQTGVWRDRYRLPRRSRREAAQKAARAADVIGIAVRHDERVETRTPKRAQRRRDDALADVEGRTGEA